MFVFDKIKQKKEAARESENVRFASCMRKNKTLRNCELKKKKLEITSPAGQRSELGKNSRKFWGPKTEVFFLEKVVICEKKTYNYGYLRITKLEQLTSYDGPYIPYTKS